MLQNIIKNYAFYIIYATVTLTPLWLMCRTKKRYKRKINKFSNEETNCKYDFIFVKYENNNCRQHINYLNPCSIKCSLVYLNKILNFIRSAKVSVDLCMYLLTNREICAELIQAHNHGIFVRCIFDFEMIDLSGSKAAVLKASGIEIKKQEKNNNLLHHKFCIVDANCNSEGSIFFGTLNLTLQGLLSNWDHVVFTNNEEIISSFSNEFEYLWKSFVEV